MGIFSLHVDTARTWRGGQNQVLQTVLGLRELGHRAALVAHPNGALRARANEGLELVALAPLSEFDLSAAWKLSRVIRRLKPAVVHTHDSHGVAMAGTALSMASMTPRPPLIMSRRVDFHLSRNALSKWKFRQVDCFVCASAAIRAIIVGDGIPENRTTVVHDGVNVAAIDRVPAANVREALWLPRDAPVVANAAALVPHKGQKHLIDAAPLVLRQVPDARFVIFGEGELRESLDRQIRSRSLEKHVFLAGFRDDALSLCKTTDVFAMSSVTEGLGSAVLEIMACGKPVVATSAGGLPEVVANNETGLLVPPRDDRALAAAIVRLLGDAELRARFGAAGRRRVEEQFSVERMVRGIVQAYERVLAQA